MQYVLWALLALAAYSAVPPLMKYVTADIPPDVAVVVTNGMLTVAALGLVVAQGRSITDSLTHQRTPAMLLAGVFLAVGIIAYYRSLSLGPVSVVTPIFGLFIASSSIVGFLLFDEVLTARKAAGIGCAVLAVYLTSTSG
jgi:transporter family protein